MASVPAGVLQPHLTHITDQKHSQETDLGAATPRTREQILYNHRTISSAGSGHRNIHHTPYQGDNGQHTLKKKWQTSILKAALAPGKKTPHRLHRNVPT